MKKYNYIKRLNNPIKRNNLKKTNKTKNKQYYTNEYLKEKINNHKDKYYLRKKVSQNVKITKKKLLVNSQSSSRNYKSFINTTIYNKAMKTKHHEKKSKALLISDLKSSQKQRKKSKENNNNHFYLFM